MTEQSLGQKVVPAKIDALTLELTPEQQNSLQEFTGIKSKGMIVTRTNIGRFQSVNIGVACW